MHFSGFTERGLWSHSKGTHSDAFLFQDTLPAISGPYEYPQGAAVSGTSLLLSSLGTDCWQCLFGFFTLYARSLLTVMGFTFSGDQSEKAKGMSTYCYCWEDFSVFFFVRGKFSGLFLTSCFSSYARNLYSLQQTFLRGRASLESDFSRIGLGF